MIRVNGKVRKSHSRYNLNIGMNTIALFKQSSSSCRESFILVNGEEPSSIFLPSNCSVSFHVCGATSYRPFLLALQTTCGGWEAFLYVDEHHSALKLRDWTWTQRVDGLLLPEFPISRLKVNPMGISGLVNMWIEWSALRGNGSSMLFPIYLAL